MRYIRDTSDFMPIKINNKGQKKMRTSILDIDWTLNVVWEDFK